jgi:hypothetical protein
MPAALEYALFWHGLIPERVYEATSVCMRRSRVFDNALGRFSYVTVPPSLFPVGMRQEQASERETFLIAGPEKALCDKVLLTRNPQARSRCAMQTFWVDDLRVDEEALGPPFGVGPRNISLLRIVKPQNSPQNRL